MPPPHSAGILLFRQRDGETEVLLIKPGGPFWRNKDAGAWMIPKGMVEPGEAPAEAALREFEEETGTQLDRRAVSAGDGPPGGRQDGRGVRASRATSTRRRSDRTSSRSNGRRAAGASSAFPRSPKRAG